MWQHVQQMLLDYVFGLINTTRQFTLLKCHVLQHFKIVAYIRTQQKGKISQKLSSLLFFFILKNGFN